MDELFSANPEGQTVSCEKEQDVVLTSRVRLARNFKDIPFPSTMNDVYASEMIRRTTDATASFPDAKTFQLLRISDITPTTCLSLIERHYISPDLANHPERGAVLLGRGDTISIMIGEEDHLRIQALLPGMQLDEAAKLANEIDDIIESQVEYAFDEEWGYLTSCPTNTGTGMRGSVMMHLPALSMIGHLGTLAQAAAKIGLTVRGIYGEGSEGVGSLYQLSNQITLGRSEEDILRGLISASKQVIERERAARNALLEADKLGLYDRIWRSIGTMLYARKMDNKEFMRLWSDARLGVTLGISDITLKTLDELMQECQPGGLMKRLGKEMKPQERDEMRADIIREALSKTE